MIWKENVPMTCTRNQVMRCQSTFSPEFSSESASLIPTYRSTGWAVSPRHRDNVYGAVMMQNRTEGKNKSYQNMVSKLRHGDEVCGKKEDAPRLEWSYFPQPERALISDEQRCSHLRHEKRELQGLPTPTPCAQRLPDPRHVGEAG